MILTACLSVAEREQWVRKTPTGFDGVAVEQMVYKLWCLGFKSDFVQSALKHRKSISVEGMA